jgi:opacity protein-like surface antigen
MFTRGSGLALVLAALCLGGRTAHAQVAPMTYWTPGWPFGLSGNQTFGQNLNTYGNFPSFDGSGAQDGGFSNTRYSLGNGWFVGSEGGPAGLSLNGVNQFGAFGSGTSVYYQGVQTGYKFQNTGVTVYGGFDTLNYKAVGSPFAPFDTVSGTLPGYSAHGGIEFQPTSNVSLSLGFAYTQQSGGDLNALLLPGASPLGVSGRR